MDNSFDDETSRRGLQHIPSREWLFLSVVSAGVYVILAYLIFYFFYESGFKQAFAHGFSVMHQIGIGLVAGCVFAAFIRFIMNRRPVSGVLDDFYIVRMVSQVRFTLFDRAQLSLFAGAGEELLFRGALQPLLGIWVTSIIFVGLHGYFKFKSVGHIVFGAMMFGLSVGLGYLFEHAGLIAAMSAHAVYDLIMLQLVQRKDR